MNEVKIPHLYKVNSNGGRANKPNRKHLCGVNYKVIGDLDGEGNHLTGGFKAVAPSTVVRTGKRKFEQNYEWRECPGEDSSVCGLRSTILKPGTSKSLVLVGPVI